MKEEHPVVTSINIFGALKRECWLLNHEDVCLIPIGKTFANPFVSVRPLYADPDAVHMALWTAIDNAPSNPICGVANGIN